MNEWMDGWDFLKHKLLPALCPVENVNRSRFIGLRCEAHGNKSVQVFHVWRPAQSDSSLSILFIHELFGHVDGATHLEVVNALGQKHEEIS